MRVISVDGMSDEFPALGKVTRRTGKLKVIDIHHQIQRQTRVPIAGPPGIDWNETSSPQARIAVLLPMAAGIRVAIKGKDQRADGIRHAGPSFGPLITR